MGDLLDSARLVLMVRPERLRLAGEAVSQSANVFQATVTEVVYQGDSFLMYAGLGDGSVVSLRGGIRGEVMSALPGPGNPVTLALDAADTVLIDGSDV